MKLLFEFLSPVIEARFSTDWMWSCLKSPYGRLVPRRAALPLPVQGTVMGFVQRQPQLLGWSTGGLCTKGFKCTIKHGDLQLHHLEK